MNNSLTSWTDIGLGDLFFAFRKAKADCFYETSVRVAEKFVLFEESLGDRLPTLLARLHSGEIAEMLREGLGEPAIFPKKVGVGTAGSATASHTFFSDAKRAFKKERGHELIPEFRMIGDFSVEVHIISALWVNLVGHKFDRALSSNALASRVRRYRRDSFGSETGDYHIEAIGSFEPYFEPYQRWRDSGLDAIKRSLSDGQGTVALTLDVSNFYHSIDPSFAVHPAFLAYADVELSSFEIAFTQAVVSALKEWSALCANKVVALGCQSSAVGGLPIGLSVVRVLSNVLLLYLDREIENSVFPLYYARYVDDVFLVLRDNESFESQDDVWHMLQIHVPSLKREGTSGSIRLHLPSWAGDTRLLFQTEKQKCFFLSGASGLDLLDNIASQIREVSSERRLMPLPEQLDQTQSARALTATNTADEADSLRRADGLTLRRLGWSVLLRSVEVLARDLRPRDWVEERSRFYEFAHDHVIRPDKILEQIDRLPRLFSISVSLGDWKPALRIWRETIAAIYALQEATAASVMKINGLVCQSTPSQVWDETRSQVRRFFREALFRSFSLEQGEPKARAFHSLLSQLEMQPSELSSLALLARETDWARIPYKEHLRLFATQHAPIRLAEEALYGRYEREPELKVFLERSVVGKETGPCQRVRHELCDKAYDSLLPFLFPTRAYTPEEIALYLPSECVFDEPIAAAHAWAEYTRAVRGVWVRSDLADEMVPPSPAARAGETEAGDATLPADGLAGGEDVRPPDPNYVMIGDAAGSFPVRIGITSFNTSDETWAQGAVGTPDLSPKRYKAIAKIVNQALKEDKKPDYLIFPELSVPERWVRTISSKLSEGRISLIAGMDYHRLAGNLIDSSAVLVMDDNRLGYTTSLQIRQRKSQPAPAEEQNLLRSHGQSWNSSATELKPVYIHNDFYFSVLVCSELQNIAYRSHLQGHVDCLFVLSWNRDLDTFSSLVDSASLDVHAYIALSNNLRYGDSRVRSPAKEQFLRDVCRVRGGVNDQLVVVEIDPRTLRAQQSRIKRWPEKSDAYKPAPEGFRMSPYRATTPS
jgi:hypothetical protein